MILSPNGVYGDSSRLLADHTQFAKAACSQHVFAPLASLPPVDERLRSKLKTDTVYYYVLCMLETISRDPEPWASADVVRVPRLRSLPLPPDLPAQEERSIKASLSTPRILSSSRLPLHLVVHFSRIIFNRTAPSGCGDGRAQKAQGTCRVSIGREKGKSCRKSNF